MLIDMQVTSIVQYTAQLLNFIMPGGDNDSKQGSTAGRPVVLNRFVSLQVIWRANIHLVLKANISLANICDVNC